MRPEPSSPSSTSEVSVIWPLDPDDRDSDTEVVVEEEEEVPDADEAGERPLYLLLEGCSIFFFPRIYFVLFSYSFPPVIFLFCFCYFFLLHFLYRDSVFFCYLFPDWFFSYIYLFIFLPYSLAFISWWFSFLVSRPRVVFFGPVLLPPQMNLLTQSGGVGEGGETAAGCGC